MELVLNHKYRVKPGCVASVWNEWEAEMEPLLPGTEVKLVGVENGEAQVQYEHLDLEEMYLEVKDLLELFEPC